MQAALLQEDERATLAPPALLRLPTVIRRTGLGRSTIYRMMAAKQFPRQVRIGARAVAWRQSDLCKWIEGRTTTSELQDRPR